MAAGAAVGLVVRGGGAIGLSGGVSFVLGGLGKTALGMWFGGGKRTAGGRDGVYDDFQTLPSGLRIKDDVVGTGTVAPPVCVATVNYTGSQHGFPPDAAAVVFDASSRHGKPLAFSIGRRRVIRGWDQGVPGMAVGGVRRLIIPSSMGYGPRGAGSIPGGATLYFTIELVDVSVAPKA
eukprot:contig_12746_g3042